MMTRESNSALFLLFFLPGRLHEEQGDNRREDNNRSKEIIGGAKRQ